MLTGFVIHEMVAIPVETEDVRGRQTDNRPVGQTDGGAAGSRQMDGRTGSQPDIKTNGPSRFTGSRDKDRRREGRQAARQPDSKTYNVST